MPRESPENSKIHGHDKAARNTLESASAHIRASLPPSGTASEGEWRDARQRETEALIAWAKETECLIDPAAVAGRAFKRGMEHEVWFDEASERWRKVTHPGEYGRFPELDYKLDKISQQWVAEVLLRIGTPGEYIERLRLGNELFYDDVRIEGVALSEQGPQVLISQSHIVGGTPTLSEIEEFMSSEGFRPGPDYSFYNPARQVAAFDALPRNFLKSGGLPVPIDLILTRVEGELRDLFERP